MPFMVYSMKLKTTDLCIGYNSLPDIASAPEDISDDDGKKAENFDFVPKRETDPSRYPMGKRVWSWIVLCEDGQSRLT